MAQVNGSLPRTLEIGLSSELASARPRPGHCERLRSKPIDWSLHTASLPLG